MKTKLAILLFLLSTALSIQQGCAVFSSLSSETEQPIYKDISVNAGITDNRVSSLEMSAGIAWGDYDNDGWVDLMVTDPKGPNTLYHNDKDGTFSVSPLSPKVALPNDHSAGATFSDIDNDGFQDLLIVSWGVNHLFKNVNGSDFVEISKQAGLSDAKNSKSGSWGDYDNDGFVDLYIANWSCYPDCGRMMDGDPDKLYHNNGDGTFSDVSDLLKGGLAGAGFIASFFDYDNDGDLDIYLVNDEYINPIGNKLWRNDGPGCAGWCFEQVAKQAGADSKLFGMGLAVGDANNDGYLDLFYSNVGPMEFLQGSESGIFTNIAEKAGVQAEDRIGWGAVFLDFNNDGWRDLYLAVSDTTNHNGIASNYLWQNDHDGSFTAVVCNNEASDPRPSLSVATADPNKDGWVDLLVANMDEGYRFYQNQLGSTSKNNTLAIELIGGQGVNADAVGSRVYIKTADGATQMIDVINGSAMGAGNELIVYAGLGNTSHADVEVRWPNGKTQTFTNVSANQRYTLTYTPDLIGDLVAESNMATLPSFPTGQPDPTNLIAFVVALVAAGIATFVFLRPGNHVFNTATLVLGALLCFGLFLLFSGLPISWGWIPADTRLRWLLDEQNVKPPTPLPAPSKEMFDLGEALFWDPELSGNRDTACVTCHHPDLGTGDGLSLPIGTGGVGLLVDRSQTLSGREFIPRNAQPIYELGYEEWKIFFWDGRVSKDEMGYIHTPTSDRTPDTIHDMLAAQALFPIISRDEMRGLRGDTDVYAIKNEIAIVSDHLTTQAWKEITRRVLAIPEYSQMVEAAFPNLDIENIGVAELAIAIGAYEQQAFTFGDSPFDQYLRGRNSSLTDDQKEGAILFYGKAGCSTCHSGGLLTDQNFYNIGVMQIGPGKGRDEPFDFGRARETGNECDKFKFRTPPLRDIELTGPYMHNGTFITLEQAIRQHFDPIGGLKNYDPSVLPTDLRDTCLTDEVSIAAVQQTIDLEALGTTSLSDQEVSLLVEFLKSLTSPSAVDFDKIPTSVPSGLPVGGAITTP